MRADLRDQARFQALIDRKDPFRNTPPASSSRVCAARTSCSCSSRATGRWRSRGRPSRRASTPSSTPAPAARRPTASRPAAAGSPRRRSAEAAGSRTPRCSREPGSTAPAVIPQLIASKRLTLPAAFRRAGWRTVADVPSTHGSWPEGKSFYHYDQIWDRDNLGYRGPKLRLFAPMPDQYMLQALQRLELAKPNRPPIFAEIDLTSSHEPWTRIPPLILLEPARRRIDLQSAADRPDRPDRHPAGIRKVDPVLPARSVFVHRALRQQEHRAHRAGRPPALTRRRRAPGPRRADLDHRPRPDGDQQALRLGLDGRHASRLDGAGLADERLPEPLPQRVRPLSHASCGRSSVCSPRRAFVSR